MRRINFFLSLIVAIVVLLSTNGCRRECYYHEVKEISFSDIERNRLSVVPLDYYPFGGYSILSVDDYVLFITNDSKGQIRIYDIEAKSEIASIASKGRAKNELIKPFFAEEQAYYRDGELIIPVIESGGGIKEINVTESILQGTAVIIDQSSSISPTNGSIAFIDNDITKTFNYMKPKASSNECLPPTYYIVDKKGVTKDIRVYGDPIIGNDVMSVNNQYLGNVFKHPTKNIMIQPLAEMEYILFFDIDRNRYFAIHQKGSRSFDDKIPDTYKNGNPANLCFGDVAVSEDYFYVLYYAKCRNDDDTDIKCEILIFDWEGNYINGGKSEYEINRISYNNKNQTLYGICISEEKLYQINIDT